MDWTSALFEMIDMRSFSNLWYWIALAVLWSTASHWILGVPFDMVQRARRHGGQAEADLAALVRINLDRIFYVVHQSGVWLTAIIAAAHTMLVITGFWYGFEFAQAVFFLAFPITVVGVMNLFTGRRIRREAARGERLMRILARHRLAVQLLGMVSILVTTMYGLSQTVLVTGPL